MGVEWLRIGEVAERSGVAVSAIRYYEHRGLIRSRRTAGGTRMFPRHVLRRIAVVQAGQRVGLSLDELADALRELPQDTAPDADDWQRLSRGWRPVLRARIRLLEALAEQLDSCIGCGCLSLQDCALRNPDDRVGRRGPGARYLPDAEV